MSGGLPFVSVVAAALDHDGLDECLASIAAVRYPEERREILVVDADPSGRAAAIVRRHPVTHLRVTPRSVTVARNRGIEASRGDIIALTDPDCLVTTTWLRSLVRAFTAPQVGMVAGAILPYPGASLPEQYMARRRSHSQERALGHPETPFAMTPNLAVRREVFTRIGGFDTRFHGGGWEDADLCWRMRSETGLEIRFAPDAPVLHRYRATTRSFFQQQFRYGYSLAVLLQKYRSELPPNWQGRAGSLGEVTRAAGDVLSTVGRMVTGASMGRDVAMSWFGLLRQLAQRGGFWSGALHRH